MLSNAKIYRYHLIRVDFSAILVDKKENGRTNHDASICIVKLKKITMQTLDDPASFCSPRHAPTR